MEQQQRGRIRTGFTMVECLAALAVLAATVCLWPPIMHLASNMATKDEEMVELQAMQRRLESYCAGGSVTTTDTGTMVFVDHQQVQHKVYQYHSQANGNILRDEGIGGGYVPILMHARKLLVSGLAPNTCAYKVTMDDGLTFRGVLNGDE